MITTLKNRRRLLLGVISDTHGHLPPPVIAAFRRVDVILHAGDIDTPAVFDALQRLAPVVAVRGNMDRGRWAADLPPAEIVTLGGLQVYMLHDLRALTWTRPPPTYVWWSAAIPTGRRPRSKTGFCCSTPGPPCCHAGRSPPRLRW